MDYMLTSQARDGRPNSAANSLPRPIISAAGRPKEIVRKLLMFLYSWVLQEQFLGVTTRLFPAGREMRRVRLGPSAPRLLCRHPAIDHALGAGHEGRIVGGEKDDLGNR
jgi:hypothetical protein